MAGRLHAKISLSNDKDKIQKNMEVVTGASRSDAARRKIVAGWLLASQEEDFTLAHDGGSLFKINLD